MFDKDHALVEKESTLLMPTWVHAWSLILPGYLNGFRNVLRWSCEREEIRCSWEDAIRPLYKSVLACTDRK